MLRRERDQIVSILVSASEANFTVMVEPEGMSYDFPAAERILLTFRGAGAMKFELGYFPGGISIWRPGDTEVWVATRQEPHPVQIGGWAENPFPSLDSEAPRLELPLAEWDHLPLPPRDAKQS